MRGREGQRRAERLVTRFAVRAALRVRVAGRDPVARPAREGPTCGPLLCAGATPRSGVVGAGRGAALADLWGVEPGARGERGPQAGDGSRGVAGGAVWEKARERGRIESRSRRNRKVSLPVCSGRGAGGGRKQSGSPEPRVARGSTRVASPRGTGTGGHSARHREER